MCTAYKKFMLKKNYDFPLLPGMPEEPPGSIRKLRLVETPAPGEGERRNTASHQLLDTKTTVPQHLHTTNGFRVVVLLLC